MPQRSQYAGRHRGRHRAEVERSARGVALPGAAAAALTLTATGAAIVPGLGGTAAASANDSTPVPTPSTQASDVSAPQAAGSSAERQELASVRTELVQAELVAKAREQALEARAASQARASRAQARKALEDKRRKALEAGRRWVVPVAGFKMSSGYGMRWGRMHTGNDLAAPTGTPVGAISSGTVIFAGTQSGYGMKVEVRHWDGTVSYYAHMSAISVQVGDQVAPGGKVGEVGSTGRSTGPHLHLEVRPGGGGPVSPLPWLLARGLVG